MKKWIIATIIILMIVLTLSLVLLLIGLKNTLIIGDGTSYQNERFLESFNSVQYNGRGKIRIVTGETNMIQVVCDKNLLPYLKTEIKGEKLRIYFSKRVKTNVLPEFLITLKTLKRLNLSGSIQLESTALLNAQTASIFLKGNCSALLNLQGEELQLKQSGSSVIQLTGNLKKCKLLSHGAAVIDGSDLKIEEATVKIQGSSRCSINPTMILNGEIKGSGVIEYQNTPEVNKIIQGSGTISQALL